MKSISRCMWLLVLVVTQVYPWFFPKSESFIYDIGRTWSMKVYAIEKPHSKSELKKLVIESTKPIAIAGGRYSQGGR